MRFLGIIIKQYMTKQPTKGVFMNDVWPIRENI